MASYGGIDAAYDSPAPSIMSDNSDDQPIEVLLSMLSEANDQVAVAITKRDKINRILAGKIANVEKNHTALAHQFSAIMNPSETTEERGERY